MNKFLRNIGLYLLIILIAISVIDHFSAKGPVNHEINYTEFISQVDQGEVSKVVIVENNIKGTLSDGTEFTTVAPGFPNQDDSLINRLQEKNVDIKAENPPEPPWWTTLLSSLLPIVVLVALWFFVMHQAQGGGGRVMSFGKSRARMSADKVKVHFEDVAGADEAKQELEEVVEF